MTNHENHSHPNTKAARAKCRKDASKVDPRVALVIEQLREDDFVGKDWLRATCVRLGDHTCKHESKEDCAKSIIAYADSNTSDPYWLKIDNTLRSVVFNMFS